MTLSLVGCLGEVNHPGRSSRPKGAESIVEGDSHVGGAVGTQECGHRCAHLLRLLVKQQGHAKGNHYTLVSEGQSLLDLWTDKGNRPGKPGEVERLGPRGETLVTVVKLGVRKPPWRL